MYLITNTQIQFLLITRACVLNYKHTNTTSNKNHPYFLDTNKQIQGLINLKRNVFLITNTQIQGLINHKHNNTNTRSKWQAGQVEQVVLGGAGSGRDQVEKTFGIFFTRARLPPRTPPPRRRLRDIDDHRNTAAADRYILYYRASTIL